MQQVTERVPGAEAGALAERIAALAERRRDAIRRAFTRLHPVALGCGVGAVAALALLGGTLLLVMRGGLRVGANLQALTSYFPGYRVDVAGAFVGGAWGLAVGFVAGFGIAAFRNLALRVVLVHARRSADRWRRRHLLDEI